MNAIEPGGPKGFTIFVNARRKQVDDEVLSFEQVVALAFDPVPTGEFVGFTVAYSKGPKGSEEGFLTEGQEVPVKSGMRFNVEQTDKS